MRIFGTAGVRGIFNISQTLQQVYSLAETVSFVFGRGAYGIGWDGRKSSSVLACVVTSAIVATGSDAVIFGLVPTPVLAYGTRLNHCFAGFSVTASHNPREFSGVKAFNEEGMEMSEEEETRVERALVVNPWKACANFGASFSKNVLDSYKEEFYSRFSPISSGLKIVVDCANGPGAYVVPEVLFKLGHKVIPINTQVSWRFPARSPEPTRENLEDTANLVVALGADLGFAHDGDADRLVMVNSAGQVLPDSFVSILAIRALGVKSRVVILSENTSSAVAEEVERLGGKVVRSKVGKTFAKLAAENAVFATEPSKIVDPTWGMWEDGMFASVLIADFLSRNRDEMDSLTAGAGWHYKQVNLHLSVDREGLWRKARESFAKFRISEERKLDGIKFVFKDDSWIMFRVSGTEPVTRIYCESKDESRLEQLLEEGIKCLESSAGTQR